MAGGVQTIIERTSLVWKVRSKHISGDIDLHAIDGGLALDSDQDVAFPVNSPGFDQVGASGIHLDGHVFSRQFELLGFGNCCRLHTNCAELLQIFVIEGCQLFLRHVTGAQHRSDLLPTDFQRSGSLFAVGELLDDVLVKRLHDIKGYAIFQGIGKDAIEGLTPIGSAVRGGGMEHAVDEVGMDIGGILGVVPL